jgi:uncharacterized C2H2 Zn-finger protein
MISSRESSTLPYGPKRPSSDDPRSDPPTPKRFRPLPTPPPSGCSNSPNPTKNKPRPNIYTCSFAPCTASFSRPCRLSEHERSHTGERPFQCPHHGCPKTFARDYHLSRHISSAHTNVRNHECEWPGCDKAFATGQRRREHQKTHEKSLQYACTGYDDACGQVFRKKKTLAAHVLKVHLGLKPFPCTHIDPDTAEPCTAAYDVEGKLREHVDRVHSGPRFFCTLCTTTASQQSSTLLLPATPPLAFTTLSALSSHKRTHHACPTSRPPRTSSSNNSSSKPAQFPPRAPRRRRPANQHTARMQAITNMSAADLLLANTADAVVELPVIECVRPGCPRRFLDLSMLEDHCLSAHEGMPPADVHEALREREALQGGDFWIGGLEPAWRLPAGDDDDDFDEGEEGRVPFEDVFNT